MSRYTSSPDSRHETLSQTTYTEIQSWRQPTDFPTEAVEYIHNPEPDESAAKARQEQVIEHEDGSYTTVKYRNVFDLLLGRQ